MNFFKQIVKLRIAGSVIGYITTADKACHKCNRLSSSKGNRQTIKSNKRMIVSEIEHISCTLFWVIPTMARRKEKLLWLGQLAYFIWFTRKDRSDNSKQPHRESNDFRQNNQTESPTRGHHNCLHERRWLRIFFYLQIVFIANWAVHLYYFNSKYYCHCYISYCIVWFSKKDLESGQRYSHSFSKSYESTNHIQNLNVNNQLSAIDAQ